MKILITGIAGFIGYHVAVRALKDGHTVIGIDNLNSYYDTKLKYARLAELEKVSTAIHGNLHFEKIDITDTVNLEKLFKNNRFDVVCHLAAQAGVRYSIENPRQYIDSNISGFFNILEACRHHHINHLIFASSSSVYGKNKTIPYTEDQKCDSQVSLYAATKKSNELLAHSYSELFGIRATGLRFFTVYGPWGRPDMAPFIFTNAIIEGHPINVFNNGDMSRDFSYVDDIVDGTYRIMTHEKPVNSPLFNIYNIGNSSPVSLADFIKLVEKHTGKSARKNYLPMQAGDVKATWADTTRITTDYGYKPKTNLDDGLKNFIEWYRSFFKVNV